MTRIIILSLAASMTVGLAACEIDEDNDNDNVGDNDNDDDNEIPEVPQLGRQIDRVGRPAITTALIGTFNPDDAAADRVKDLFNAAGEAQWAGFTDDIAGNLAIYDGLDGVCGNQLLAGDDAAAGRYDVLAGLLADDRLYVNTASTTCEQYLAVEANAVGIANEDCGGRTLTTDVIDTSYSVLAIGALEGVTDAVDADADADHSDDDFPFVDPF